MERQINFKTRTKTSWVLIVLVAVVIAWDVYAAYFSQGVGDTFSEVILGFARRHPVLPFSVGVICGHLFYPQEVRD